MVPDSNTNEIRRGRVKKAKSRNGLMAAFLAIVFLLFVFPLLRSDLRLGSAVNSKNSSDLINTVTSWPRSCYLMAKAEQAYSDAGANDLALKISFESVESNPKCFNSWRHIFENPLTSVSDKLLAQQRMSSLDPLLELK
jgi:hypothetical protein